jgi:hypothetical protein
MLITPNKPTKLTVPPHGTWPTLVAAISRLVDRAEIPHHGAVTGACC